MSSPTIVVFGLLYLELLPFARMKILLLFSAVFCDIEFKVCIRICLWLSTDQVRILTHLTLFWVIAFCLNLLFHSFLCCFFFLDIDIKFCMRICVDIIQNWLNFCILQFVLAGIMPLWNLLGPMLFSSPEPKAQVSYCQSAPSVVRPSVRPSVRRRRRRPSSSSVRKLFTFSTSSPKPLDGFWWNLVGMKYSWSLTSVVVFRPDPPRGGSRVGPK